MCLDIDDCMPVLWLVLIMQMEMCPNLYWSMKEGIRTVQFDVIPFSIEKATLYDCQYGEHYWKDKPCQKQATKIIRYT